MPNNKKSRKKQQRPQQVVVVSKKRPRNRRKQGQPSFWQQLGKGASIIGKAFLPTLAKLTGIGDYQIHNNTRVNSLFTTGQYSFEKKKVVMTHSEYIGDVITGQANTFSYQTYGINPGDHQTFPWLSSIAQNFESYKIHGMVFEYKSMSADALNSTNTALGQVILSCQYDSASPPFTNKITQEQYDGSISVKPSKSVLFGVECQPSLNVLNQLYIRNEGLPANTPAQFCDLGVFQISTNGFQASNVNIGELWVNYQIEFIHEKLDRNPVDAYAHFKLSNPTPGFSNFTSAVRTGLENFQPSGGGLTFDRLEPGNYLVTVAITGSSMIFSTVGVNYSGVLSALPLFGSTNSSSIYQDGQTKMTAQFGVEVTSQGTSTLQWNISWIGSATYADVIVTQIGDPQ